MHESGEDPNEVLYCGVLSCWCHSDSEYHDTFTNPENMLAVEPSDSELVTTYRFYGMSYEEVA